MTASTALLLLVLAVDVLLVAVTAALVLSGRGWARSAPRMAMILWQACGLSLVLALVGIVGLVLSPYDEAQRGAGVGSCIDLLRHRLSSAHLLTPTAALSALAVAVIARLGYRGVVRAIGTRRYRSRHREALDLLDGSGDTDVPRSLPAARPFAYSVPGRGGRIVVTTGALQVLSTDELRAVVEHERAHLRGRHHLVLLAARAFRDAFPRSPLSRKAALEVAELVEFAADDAAAQAVGRQPTAEALRRLSALSDASARRRVGRLVTGVAGPTVLARCGAAVLSLVLVAAPTAVAAGPLAAHHVSHLS